jgi:hypothetical protein
MPINNEPLIVQDRWVTIEAERALYVDRGRTVVLCDRLPSPVTLVLKLPATAIRSLSIPGGEG